MLMKHSNWANYWRLNQKFYGDGPCSQEDAAKIIEVNQYQTYAVKERGEVEFTASEIEALCRAWKDENKQPLTFQKFMHGPAGEPPDREPVEGFNKEGV